MNTTTASQVYVSMFSNYLDQLQVKRPDLQLNRIRLPIISSSNCERLSLGVIESLVSRIAEITNNQSFGLDIGEHIHPSDYGIFGYAMMNCSTLAQAAELVVNYGSILNQAFNVKLPECGNNIHFKFDNNSLEIKNQIIVKLHISSVVQIVRSFH